MRIVTGDYSVSVYEGTEQYRSPQVLVPHPEYNKTTNDADIMLIKVRDYNGILDTVAYLFTVMVSEGF